MNNLKTVALMATLGAILVVVGGALGGRSGAVFALVIAAGMNFAMYFWSDKLAMRAARARPVTEAELPQVYAMIRSLAQRENMPMPDIYFVESPQPNAFATGRNPNHAAVAVTRGILELMSAQELEGVLAHELAHVKNRDILISSIAATIAVALTFITRMAMWRAFLGGGHRGDNNPLAAIIGIVSIIVAPLAAMIIRSAISRSREYESSETSGTTSRRLRMRSMISWRTMSSDSSS